MNYLLKANKQPLAWVLPISLLLGGQSAAMANSTNQIENAGTAVQILIPAIALGTTIVHEDGHDGTVQFFKSLAASQITTEVLKNVTHERRPNGGCCKSFPSGHTSAAFMGASFIHKRYGLRYAIPAYLGATFVGYSRVQAKKHYTHDVLAGAAIGTLSSFYFTKPYKGFTVSPMAEKGGLGLSLGKEW